jgi:hypothetical protein
MLDETDRNHLLPTALPRKLGDVSQSLLPSLKDGTFRAVTPEMALYCFQRAKFLLGAFRRDDANDPEIYVDTIAAILSDYPQDVIAAITDPRAGIQTRQHWPPSPYEVKQACEAEMRPRREGEAHARLEAQLARRAEFDAEDEARKSHPTRAELEAKLGRTIEPSRRRDVADQLTPFSAGELVISEETKNSPLVQRALREMAI